MGQTGPDEEKPPRFLKSGALFCKIQRNLFRILS